MTRRAGQQQRRRICGSRDAIYHRYYDNLRGWHSDPSHYGVRTDCYKLIHFEGDIYHWELYDLEENPAELENLYGVEGYSAVREHLHERLAELRRELEGEA